MRPRINKQINISKLDEEFNKLTIQVQKLDKKISVIKHHQQNIENYKKSINEIEKTYKKNNLLSQIKFNSDYANLKNLIKNNYTGEISKIEAEILNLTDKVKKNRSDYEIINIRIKQESRKKKVEEILQPMPITTQKTKIVKAVNTKVPPVAKTYCTEIDWRNVKFGDGFIQIACNSKLFRVIEKKSISSLNKILHYYNFHNIPKLKIEIYYENYVKILNEEILFFNISFLKVVCSNFGFIRPERFKIQAWRNYDKRYYKNTLPFALHTKTLKQLCEYSSDNLPIIPTAEVVLNSSGSKIIHHSFLFILWNTRRKEYILVWESVEESKASYIFKIGNNLENTQILQGIFDYIAGENINKRSTIIQNSNLQKSLKFHKRIYHTDFNNWNLELSSEIM